MVHQYVWKEMQQNTFAAKAAWKNMPNEKMAIDVRFCQIREQLNFFKRCLRLFLDIYNV